jgi:hypothetical protein
MGTMKSKEELDEYLFTTENNAQQYTVYTCV